MTSFDALTYGTSSAVAPQRTQKAPSSFSVWLLRCESGGFAPYSMPHSSHRTSIHPTRDGRPSAPVHAKMFAPLPVGPSAFDLLLDLLHPESYLLEHRLWRLLEGIGVEH